MLVLAVDTCLAACQVALARDGALLAEASEAMSRGHQERLAPLVRDTLAGAGVAFGEIDLVGVTVGPGSFTGLRTGLAFAKGLALALGRPCRGVTTLAALARSADLIDGVAVVAIARGRLAWQVFEAAAPASPIEAQEAACAARAIAGRLRAGGRLVGPPELAAQLGVADARALLFPSPQAVSALALNGGPPEPLYLRPAL